MASYRSRNNDELNRIEPILSNLLKIKSIGKQEMNEICKNKYFWDDKKLRRLSQNEYLHTTVVYSGCHFSATSPDIIVHTPAVNWIQRHEPLFLCARLVRQPIYSQNSIFHYRRWTPITRLQVVEPTKAVLPWATRCGDQTVQNSI